MSRLRIAVVSAFLLERLDTTARDEEDVALALGTTVMGSIPTLGLGHRSGASSLVMLSTGGSSRIAAAREAFRRLEFAAVPQYLERREFTDRHQFGPGRGQEPDSGQPVDRHGPERLPGGAGERRPAPTVPGTAVRHGGFTAGALGVPVEHRRAERREGAGHRESLADPVRAPAVQPRRAAELRPVRADDQGVGAGRRRIHSRRYASGAQHR